MKEYIFARPNEAEDTAKRDAYYRGELIRCKDCKWKQGDECVRFADVRPFADDFCSRAERKES